MTLQYRTRNTTDDERWNQRIRLSRLLLTQFVDWWCRDESRAFPLDSTVASFLYLFSPRCDPLSIQDGELRERLFNFVGSSADEYKLTWPKHDPHRQSELIDSLNDILLVAVKTWDNTSLSELPITVVNQQVVDEVVSHKYVTFYRYQTTRRDEGGFHPVF